MGYIQSKDKQRWSAKRVNSEKPFIISWLWSIRQIFLTAQMPFLSDFWSPEDSILSLFNVSMRLEKWTEVSK